MKEKSHFRDALVYLTGTYPLVSTTFIDRELEYLEQHGFAPRVVSIRPIEGSLSEEQQARVESVTYLHPIHVARFVASHIRFGFGKPRTYFSTLYTLFTRTRSGWRARWKTVLHFGTGVYAAERMRDWYVCHIHVHFMDRAAVVAYVAAKLLDLSYSVTAHANDIFVEPLVPDVKLCHAKFVVTVSQYNKQHLFKLVPELQDDRVHVLLPPPDLARFTPEREPRPAAKQILSVGRLVEQKGHADLIRACAHLSNRGIEFECRIIGDGPLRASLQALIHELRVEPYIQLMGAQPAGRVYQEMAWADLFVLACTLGSDGSRDGMPVAIQEAMMMELPIITTDLVGIRELVSPESGVVVPPNDPCTLADALQTVLTLGVEERKRMGRSGRATIVKKFNGSHSLEHLEKLFRAAMETC